MKFDASTDMDPCKCMYGWWVHLVMSSDGLPSFCIFLDPETETGAISLITPLASQIMFASMFLALSRGAPYEQGDWKLMTPFCCSIPFNVTHPLTYL